VKKRRTRIIKARSTATRDEALEYLRCLESKMDSLDSVARETAKWTINKLKKQYNL